MIDNISLKRNEYTNELVYRTKDAFMNGIKGVYKDAMKVNRSRRFILRDFQYQLRGIASWTNDKIEEELAQFNNVDEIENILKNIIVLNYNIFILENTQSIEQPVQCEFKLFMYNVYLNIARECWRRPYLLYDHIDRHDYFKNMKDLEKLIVANIKHIVRSLTPLSTIHEMQQFPTEQHDQPEKPEQNEHPEPVESRHSSKRISEASQHESVSLHTESDVDKDMHRDDEHNDVDESESESESIDCGNTIDKQKDRRIIEHETEESDVDKYSVVSSKEDGIPKHIERKRRSQDSAYETIYITTKNKKRQQKVLDKYKKYIKLNHIHYLINKKKINKSSLF